MTQLKTSRDYVGAVDDPETGETIQLDSDIKREVAKRLTSNYVYLSLASSEDTHPTNDDGEPLCVGKDEGQCSRVVDTPGGRCWQH
jgi:hypothetical protein